MGPPLAEKRAQLIHPPKSNFLKMEAAALIYLKTAAWPCYGRKRPSAITAVFFIPQGSTPIPICQIQHNIFNVPFRPVVYKETKA